MKSVQIGILGFGTVGSGVVKLIQENGALLEQRLGGQVVIRRIADTDIHRRRNVDVDPTILTTDAAAVLEDPAIDIIVELIGGCDIALRFCREALNRNKHLVTANKALLATHGLELYRIAAARRVSIGFEASVCGGIPLIRAMKEGLVADRVRSIIGIVNGTCNYILTTMTDSRRPFAEVLAEAQAHGYAEADPSFDVDGIDSAHKLQILATLAFGTYVPFDRIHVEGIRQIDASDIEYARELGYRIKLLAIAKQLNGELEARVHAALVPEDHLLASVGGVHNAVYVVGDAVGSLMFYGAERDRCRPPLRLSATSPRSPGACCTIRLRGAFRLRRSPGRRPKSRTWRPFAPVTISGLWRSINRGFSRGSPGFWAAITSALYPSSKKAAMSRAPSRSSC